MKKVTISSNQLIISLAIPIVITMFSIPVFVTGGFHTTTFYGRVHIIQFIQTSMYHCSSCYHYGIDWLPLLLQFLILFLIPFILFIIYNFYKH